MSEARSVAANWRNGLAPNDLGEETLNSGLGSELEVNNGTIYANNHTLFHYRRRPSGRIQQLLDQRQDR